MRRMRSFIAFDAAGHLAGVLITAIPENRSHSCLTAYASAVLKIASMRPQALSACS